MIFYVKGHSFEYEMEKLTRLFFPFEKINFVYSRPQHPGELFAAATVEKSADFINLFAAVYYEDSSYENKKTVRLCELEDESEGRETEHLLAGLLFESYCSFTNYRPEWGILTGIRPAKLFRRFEENTGLRKTVRFFNDRFKVRQDKLDLLEKTAHSENNIINRSSCNSVSIYISIPFCPSRCSYCSFVSHSIERAAELIPEYLEKLIYEIKYTAKIVSRLNLKVETVYVGGGTPTTLTAEQLDLLMNVVRECFGYDFQELTVEAGRPDTVTIEKLKVLKHYKIDRISINPQTMNNEVLKKIGRRHTAEQVLSAFNLARDLNFNNINMDLIAGLPGDVLSTFKNTVESIIKLAPESVTVHALSLKRSAGLVTRDTLFKYTDETAASEMVSYAEQMLEKNGILPYYMYRQSKTVGNLENVGYARPGFEGLYNVYIMDETHTILACGASAVSKLKSQTDKKIERIFNFKYPYEYINRFEEIINRKSRVEEFYNAHS